MIRIRTGYSFRQAVGHLSEVISRLKEVGAERAPITDRGSTFAWVSWDEMARKEGFVPAFGVELGVSPSINAPKRPTVDHWVFLARGSIEPINRLVELATQQFRYQPLLTVEQALKAAKTVSVILGSKPQIDWTKKPPKGAWLGVSPATSRGLLGLARKAGWGLCATGENRFPRPPDEGWYETLAGRNANVQTFPQHILSPEEWRESVAHLGLGSRELGEAERASAAILAASTAVLEKAELPEPRRPASLRKLCEVAAKELGVNLKDRVYKERLDRELKLIAAKGYEDYFYIVSDLCRWARQNMIVGPARGSSCGSLVCYLLRITTVDPIPHGLIFERFVDVNRNDMPDIDIDFSDQQRSMVFKYLNETYGTAHVARLGVTTTYQPRSALRECQAALQLSPWLVNAVNESLIIRSSGDSRALQALEDTLYQTPAGKKLLATHPEAKVAMRFEGHPRHYSQHAAGVVVAKEAITKYVAIDHRSGAAMCDKHDAEKLNLLKIDALGLTQLSVFEDTLEAAGLPKDHLETLPLNDKKAFKVLHEHKFAGIFQFNGVALQSIIREFKADKFDDIVSVTALARPGPLASGGAAEWLRRRQGIKPVSYPHKLFEPYLKDTLGIVLYQEQVMEIGRNVGDLDWGQVTALRKAMSRSLGKEFFDQFGDPWKRGAIAKGVAPEVAAKVWDDLCAYGSWSFNKSHSVAYGLISYWCCWLKAHYPHAFAAATLTHELNADQQIKILRELAKEGIGYVPVDAKKSIDRWTVGTVDKRPALIGPLHNVRGIGPMLVTDIMASRKRKKPMSKRAEKLLANPVTSLDSLTPIQDAFDRLLPNPLAIGIQKTPTKIAALEKEERDKIVIILCTLKQIKPRDENEAILVAKRGYPIKGNLTAYLNLRLQDDTDDIHAKVNRFDYPEIAPDIIERGRPGTCLYAIRGQLLGHRGNPGDTFKMIRVTGATYVGDLDHEHSTEGQSVPGERDGQERETAA